MNELINEIINEANNKEIIIDGDSFPIAFNTIIYENNNVVYNNIHNDYPTLIIKNKKLFLDKINCYILLALSKNLKFPPFTKNIEKNKIKTLITYLFVNATTEEFSNPIKLIDKNIDFLNDETFNYLNDEISINLINCLQQSTIKIRNEKQSIFMETPNKLKIYLEKTNNNELMTYHFPSISYGITINENNEKECYIYSILNSKEKKETNEEKIKYQKRISRELYKLNANVYDNESIEYHKFKQNNTEYYPENISDVSPSALISLTVFLSLLEKENITKIKVIPYLPVRYLSRELIIDETTNENKQKLLEERNILIQRNITDKFIRTFRRIKYHLKGIEITSFPYEVSEFLEMKLNSIEFINNQILNEIYNNIQLLETQKKLR